MLNIGKSYAKIWEVEDKGNYIKAKIGTSRKDKRNDTYINSNWFAVFLGKCADQAKGLQKGDKIIIANGTVESVYDKEKQRAYTNVVVFEFEQEQQQAPQGTGFK